jgi:tetratricopeptide (TPR) repeat protein
MRILEGAIPKKTVAIFTALIVLGLAGTFYLYRSTTNQYTQYPALVLGGNFESLDTVFQNYLQDKKDNSERWMTFMSILATLFAVFFVYTGFKIDSTKDKVDEAEKRILETERKINEDIFEYGKQLEYAMSFIMQKQYQKAIDALTVLRNEPFVLKYDWKINTCCFFLAHCYYERGVSDRNPEDLALAVEYINQAISDSSHPYKNEIINAFEALDKALGQVKQA